MVFELERIERIAKDLSEAMYSDKASITTYKSCDGKDKPTDESQWGIYETGSLWGGYDKHRWFKVNVIIPDRFKDKRVIFKITTGHEGEWDALNPQFLIYVNGKIVQGLDVNHREITLSEKAEPGKEYIIEILGYSGLYERKVMISTDLYVLDREIENLYYDIKVPASIAELLEEDDDNRIKLLNKLGQAIDMLDLREIYSDEFYDSVHASREYLKRELYTNVNYENPLVTAIGHTHIDVAWLWTIAQTKEKTIRSFSTVLNLMKEYPEYKFMSSQPQLYEYVKENEPELYEEIKERIKEKRWEVDGAMWLEADCNIPSGESLIRQIIFGHKFFKDEFDIQSKSLWLPDVFGYSAALPQILKKSGIEYFMTTKLDWNQFNMIPNDTFIWRGIDGSEVLTHLVTTSDYKKAGGVSFNEQRNKTTYTGIINPNQVMGTWKRYQNKNLSSETLMLFGYGDGGGGPTKEMLENARRLKYGLPGCPRVDIGFETEFFDRLNRNVKESKELPTWVGELYLEYHRGTYTSIGKNKRNNRKGEVLLQDLETLYSINKEIGGEYPKENINKAWKTLLLNQFHDIIPGSSIKQVYEDSDKQYEEMFNSCKELKEKAITEISSNINLEDGSIIVFNTLSFDRDDLIEAEIPKGLEIKGLRDNLGNIIDIQKSHDGNKIIFFTRNIPSKGYKSYRILKDESVAKYSEYIKVFENYFENDFFKVKFDKEYNIISLFDKKNCREVLKDGAKGNSIKAYEDRPMRWENWDIDIYYKKKMWEVNDIEKAEFIERGPIRYCLRVTRRFCKSRITQDMYFYRDIPRIDFKTVVNWQEKNILLKAEFPVDINTDKATYDIQYGNVERPTHSNTSWDVARFEVCGHKWADLSEGSYGVSLLNDCKYGHDIQDGIMRLTLLKSGTYPNPDADLGIHEFTYSIYPHKGTWREANTVKMAYKVNVPAYGHYEEKHKGELNSQMSLVSLESQSCSLEIIKEAEEGKDTIIRLYEYSNTMQNVTMTFNRQIREAHECSMLEIEEKSLELKYNSLTFEMKPYEIKTLKIKF